MTRILLSIALAATLSLPAAAGSYRHKVQAPEGVAYAVIGTVKHRRAVKRHHRVRPAASYTKYCPDHIEWHGHRGVRRCILVRNDLVRHAPRGFRRH